MRAATRRSWWKTGVGLALTGLMLFWSASARWH